MANEKRPVPGGAADKILSAVPADKKPVSVRSRKSSVPKIEIKTIAAKPQGGETVSATMLLALLTLLALAGLNLYIVVDQYGQLDGLRQSWNELLVNYATRSPAAAVQQPAPVPAPVEKPVALYSIVQGDRLIPQIESMVVDPLIDWYAAVGSPLKGVYVEQKIVGSKLIRVHLFFRAGSDMEFLWTFTGKETDWWLPNCSLPGAASAKKTPCPAEFLDKYPSIAQLIR